MTTQTQTAPATTRPARGFALPCLKCGETAAITLRLDAIDQDNALRCCECEAEYSLADVQGTVGVWTRFLAWAEDARPCRRSEDHGRGGRTKGCSRFPPPAGDLNRRPPYCAGPLPPTGGGSDASDCHHRGGRSMNRPHWARAALRHCGPAQSPPRRREALTPTCRDSGLVCVVAELGDLAAQALRRGRPRRKKAA